MLSIKSDSLSNKLYRQNIIPGFRNDINALRAIAVIGVILYHYKFYFFSGGFAGVDIFFVISGYLMTKIIFSSLNDNEFSFKTFVSKRLKRIVPPLLFLVLILIIAEFFLYFPEDYKANQKNAAASILFLSNILYWKSSGYFTPSSETNIMLHTWSLSVEWQFYLIYPLILLCLNKLFVKRRSYLLLFIGTTFIFYIFSSEYVKFNPNASFYLLPNRSWEMLIGGIAFFMEGFIKWGVWRKLVAVFGYLSILLSVVLLNKSMLWPGPYTLYPVIATFLIIIANYDNFILLKLQLVQTIGKISYSLYLWHWPVYVIAQYFGIGNSLVYTCSFTMLSFFLGYLSFKYIESVEFSTKSIAVAILLLFAITTSLSVFNSNVFLWNKKTLELVNYANTHLKEREIQYSLDTCFVGRAEVYKYDRCLCIDKNKKNILLIGDSHMGQYSQSFRERLSKKDINILQVTVQSTLPTLKDYQHRDANRRKLLNYAFYNFIPKNAKNIDGVIISGMWDDPTNRVSQDSILLGINETMAYLKKFNINTIIIGQTEHYTIPYSRIAAWDFKSNIKTNKLYLESYAYELDSFLNKYLAPYYIKVINTKSFPGLSNNNQPYMADEHHVTKYGADLIVDKVLSDPITINFLNQHNGNE